MGTEKEEILDHLSTPELKEAWGNLWDNMVLYGNLPIFPDGTSSPWTETGNFDTIKKCYEGEVTEEDFEQIKHPFGNSTEK